MLGKEELKRYSRQIILPEIGLDGQEKLKCARVLVIGAGGLGCPVLQYLAAAGVGHIGIVDNDTVEESNLQRQILFYSTDVGTNKAETAVKKLLLLNPFLNLKAFPVRLSAENCEEIIQQYDLIIDGSDNFQTRYLINDCCLKLNKPLVFGSIFRFEGQISVFNYLEGPTLRCIYPEFPAANEVPNCSEIGVLGVLPGLVGMYMANEALKIICNIGEPLSGKLLVIDALNCDTRLFQFKRTISNNSTLLKPENTPLSNPPAPIVEISGDELKNCLEQKQDIYLVDIREPYEFEEYNIGGHNIPLNEISQRISELPVDSKIVFCCQTGQRSRVAVMLVKQQSFKGEVLSLKDGITNY